MSTLTTDESLRSQLEYGDPEYPFSFYTDRFEPDSLRQIGWHWHDEPELSYVKEGEVFCCIGSERISLKAGSGLFINGGVIHRFETEGGAVLANFIFQPEFIAGRNSLIYSKYVSPLLLSDLKYEVYDADAKGNSDFLSLLKKVYEAAGSKEYGSELYVRNIVAELWRLLAARIETEDSVHRQSTGISQSRLKKMLSFIHANYNRKISLEDIALAANISKSEALRCFKAIIETTPVKYLNDYRLMKAALRLKTSDDPVTVIAVDGGFESTGYFCKAFKARYGVSAGYFRKH